MNVRLLVAGQDALGTLLNDLGRRRQVFLAGLLLQRTPAVVKLLAQIAVEPVRDRPAAAAALEGVGLDMARLGLGRPGVGAGFE